jgi:hypothetical protein
MSFGSYSTTPASNTTCNGINVAENCPAANVNNAIRQIMADGRSLYDTVAGISLSSYMLKTGGAFTGTITRNGAGGYWYHANASQATGPVYTQTSATALPTSPAEGTVVMQY